MEKENTKKIRKMLENGEIITENNEVKYQTEDGYQKAIFGWDGLENVPTTILEIMKEEKLDIDEIEKEIRKIKRRSGIIQRIDDLDYLDAGSEFEFAGEARYVKRKKFTRKDGSEGSILSFYLYDGSSHGLRIVVWDTDYQIKDGDRCIVKGVLKHNKYTDKLELHANFVKKI